MTHDHTRSEHQAHRGQATGAVDVQVPPAEHSAHAGQGGAGHGAHASHNKHAGHHTEAFRRRFWVCLGLSVPVVLTSHMVMDLSLIHI